MFADYGTNWLRAKVTDRHRPLGRTRLWLSGLTLMMRQRRHRRLNGKDMGRPQPGRQRGSAREDRPNRPAVMVVVWSPPWWL